VVQVNVCPARVTAFLISEEGLECQVHELFSPLWLKSVPGWPAISVSTSQQFRVGQKVWFGWLSASSQLSSRVGEGGGVWQLFLHSITQSYTTWPRWREQGGGLRSLPLGTHLPRQGYGLLGVRRRASVPGTLLSCQNYGLPTI
jgi:hypothetical protein